MPGFDDIKKMSDKHDDKVDEGLEKAGDAVAQKTGHEEQIDNAVDQAQERTGAEDQAN